MGAVLTSGPAGAAAARGKLTPMCTGGQTGHSLLKAPQQQEKSHRRNPTPHHRRALVKGSGLPRCENK